MSILAVLGGGGEGVMGGGKRVDGSEGRGVEMGLDVGE